MACHSLRIHRSHRACVRARAAADAAVDARLSIAPVAGFKDLHAVARLRAEAYYEVINATKWGGPFVDRNMQKRMACTCSMHRMACVACSRLRHNQTA